MRSVRRDLAYAFQASIRNPGFTAAAVLTLALGIGANLAIFSLAHAEKTAVAARLSEEYPESNTDVSAVLFRCAQILWLAATTALDCGKRCC